MRKSDIGYTPNPPHYYPPLDYKKMTLQELVNTYIKMCAKANGLVSVCSKCQTPCEHGKRAIQLLSGAIYDEPNVPLFANNSLIKKVVEENKKRKEEKEMAEVKETPKRSKNDRQYLDDWYEKAVASGDPVTWVMEQFGITKTKAKSKIYCWRYRHKETTEEVKSKDVEVVEVNFKEEKSVETPVVKEEKSVEPDSIEAKMDALMKLQDKHKKIMDEYKAQYEKAKQNYEEIGKKIDILCSAMDILNDN